MKRPDSMDFRLECGFAVAAACLCAVPALAQTAAPQPTQPPVASGPGSLTGIWNNVGFKDYRTGPPTRPPPSLKDSAGQPILLLPWAQAIAQKRIQDEIDGHPFAHGSTQCLPPGMPSATGTPEALPLQFVELPGQVTVLLEYFSQYRIIRLNQKHLDDPDPTYMGDSVGHWEGDTLVVDTIGLNDKTDIRSVIPHTEALHVIERIRRTGPNTMEDVVTLDDPKTFSKPWVMVNRFKQVPGMRIMEYICDNNRNGPDANGNATAKLSAAAK